MVDGWPTCSFAWLLTSKYAKWADAGRGMDESVGLLYFPTISNLFIHKSEEHNAVQFAPRFGMM